MSIRLAGSNDEVVASAPFVLSVRYRNVSTNDMISVHEYVYMEDDDSYSFSVKSPSGKNVSPSIKPILEGSGAVHVLNPGQMFEVGFKLSELCKLDEAGTYIVIATFRDVENLQIHKAFKVASNALKIKVVPEP
jgi:quinol monooxygenase YgiN